MLAPTPLLLLARAHYKLPSVTEMELTNREFKVSEKLVALGRRCWDTPNGYRSVAQPG